LTKRGKKSNTKPRVVKKPVREKKRVTKWLQQEWKRRLLAKYDEKKNWGEGKFKEGKVTS